MTIRPPTARPQGLVAFARANAPWLGAGATLTFASSFGQTFFIAVFAGEIRTEFGLSHGAWGAIYTAGTVLSAALMLWAGALTDRYRTRTLAAAVLVLLAGACAFTALAWSGGALVAAIFALRFCGQGMLYHTAIVSMGRWFSAHRGRAVAVAGLGIAAGEAVLPLAFVSLIALVGWRGAWGVAAGVAILLAPLVPLLLRRERTPQSHAATDASPGMEGRHWTRPQALGHWLFWATFPGFLAAPVFGTAFMFQQAHMAEIKAWTLPQFAALFPLYVVCMIPATFVAGWAADRFGAGRALPAWPLILSAGLGVAAIGETLPAAALAMALLGAQQGAGAALSGAFWPEMYGTRHLGAIRAAASSVMVFATALGPGLSGWLLDLGVGFEIQLAGMSAYALVMSGVFLFAMRRARPAFRSSVAADGG